MKTQTSFFSFIRLRGAFFLAPFLLFLVFFTFIPSVSYAKTEKDLGIVGNGITWVGDKVIDGVSGAASSGAETLLKPLALALLGVEAFVANAAAALFVTMLDPAAFSALMNNPLVYEIWKITRDTMNMVFILVLLFSAFATIYQIDKYKYNRILLMVVLMALLVNFSWPISRLIVDFFNSMMYFLVQSVFQTSPADVGSGLLAGVDLKSLFLGEKGKDSWESILLAIVVLFIFMMTLLVLSVMMLIRLAALPLLVMFSPVGFAGLAVPFTHSHAMKWWSKLFTYASYGPICVFLVLVAVRMLQGAQTGAQTFKESISQTMTTMTAGPGTNGVIGTEALVSIAYFALPIILFWFALTQAEKMSSEIGPMAINFGSKASKWAGKRFSGYNRLTAFGTAWNDHRKKAYADAEGRSLMTRLGKGLSRKQDQLATRAGFTSGIRSDARKRIETEEATRVKEAVDKNKTEDQSVAELNSLAESGNKFERAAAVLELASRSLATGTQLNGANGISRLFGEGSLVDRQLRNKMKSYDPSAAFTYSDGLHADQLEGFVKSNQFDAKKLRANSLNDPNLMRIMLENNAISLKDLDELRLKGGDFADNIKNSLSSLASQTSSADLNGPMKAYHMKLQQAFLAQHGKFSSAIAADVAWKAKLFEDADKDVLKRVDVNFMTTSNMNLMAANLKQKNYTSIITDMSDGAAAVRLNQYVSSSGNNAPTGTNARRLSDMIGRSQVLRQY